MDCLNCGTEVRECACCDSWVHDGSGLTACESSAVAAHLGIAEWAGPWTAYPARDLVT
jgi:hypothetical protein